MTVGDVWYFLFNFYSYINNIFKIPDFNILCQLGSYFSHYLSAISEISMLSADYILLRVLYFSNELVHLTSLKKNAHSKILVKKTCLKNVKTLQSSLDTNKNVETKAEKYTLKNSPRPVGTLSEKEMTKRKCDFYSKITDREGFHIILIVFVCLYSLSFILWTHGVNEREETITKNTDIEFAEDINLSKLCGTFGFAKKFMSIYSTLLATFRLVCLVLNVMISVIYHIKFRGHLRNIITSQLKTDQNKKKFSFKTLKLFYSANCISLKDNQTTESSTERNTNKPHSIHLLFVQFYAIFALLYSFFILPVVAKELLDAIYQFKKYTLSDNLSPHITIPNYNVSIEFPILADFEALVFEEKNQTEDKNMTATFMNSFFYLSPDTPSNYDFVINLCQKFAHMIKLPVLIYFLVHVNILLEFKQ